MFYIIIIFKNRKFALDLRNFYLMVFSLYAHHLSSFLEHGGANGTRDNPDIAYSR